MTAGETGQGFNDFVAGFASGAAGVAAGYPIETTKVQMQTRHIGNPYSGYREVASNVHRAGWVRGFFRGMSFPLVSQGLVSCIGLGVAGHALSRLSDGAAEPSYLQIYMAGAIGGAAMATIDCPAELVKTVMQSQIPRNVVAGQTINVTSSYFSGPIHCIRHILKTRGISGLYRGVVINTIRDSPGCAFYFLSFHVYHDLISKLPIADEHGLLASLIGGGLAGCTQWTVVMPIDVLKSQIQADYTGAKYKGTLDCLKITYKKLGVRGFYTGWGLAVMMAFPVGCAEFFTYSQGLHFMNWLRCPRNENEL